MTISFIGAGNVAWHLAQAFQQSGCTIHEIYSRRLSRAQALAALVPPAQPTDSLDFSTSPARIFIISITDDALADVVPQLRVPENAIVVHTAGTQPLDVLNRFPHRGVLYPLQTFSRHVPVEMSEVPFCIEANSVATENELMALAQRISSRAYCLSSAERKTLHVGAVFACNFVNHLFSVAHGILERDGLSFDMLHPLIRETVRKALSAENPVTVQTGPAVRSDATTMHAHDAYLQNRPDEQNFYRLLSESIQRYREKAT